MTSWWTFAILPKLFSTLVFLSFFFNLYTFVYTVLDVESISHRLFSLLLFVSSFFVAILHHFSQYKQTLITWYKLHTLLAIKLRKTKEKKKWQTKWKFIEQHLVILFSLSNETLTIFYFYFFVLVVSFRSCLMHRLLIQHIHWTEFT